MTFSRPTLELFVELLPQVRLDPMHPNLVEMAEQIATARAELAEAFKALPVVVALADDEPADHAAQSNGKLAAEESLT